MRPRQIEIAAQAGIDFPTVLPLFSSAPKQEAIEAWVKNHYQNELVHAIAKKIALNINYIPFEKFLAQLKITVADFNARVRDRYVLWIPQNSENASSGCSDVWVAGLALEHCSLRWPEAIVKTDQLNKFLIENPQIRHILILDDAAYSGSHIKDELNASDFYENDNDDTDPQVTRYRLFIGIPFITTVAKEKIQNKYFLSTDLLPHIQIGLAKDVLNEEEVAYLDSNNLNLSRKTLTYFDHRFPDCWSTLPHLEDGNHLLSSNIINYMEMQGYALESQTHHAPLIKYIENPNEWSQLVAQHLPNSDSLIPTIISPYRLHTERGQSSLQEALEKKQVGVWKNYPIPERYRETINILTEANLPVSIAKKQTLHFSEANTQLFFKPFFLFASGIGMMGLLLKLTCPVLLLAFFVILLAYYKSATFETTQLNQTQNLRSSSNHLS
jgi:hypothetical protein